MVLTLSPFLTLSCYMTYLSVGGGGGHDVEEDLFAGHLNEPACVLGSIGPQVFRRGDDGHTIPADQGQHRACYGGRQILDAQHTAEKQSSIPHSISKLAIILALVGCHTSVYQHYGIRSFTTNFKLAIQQS